MLGKLFKYEMKATARYYLPMLPVIILLGIVNKLLLIFLPDNPIMKGISGFTVAMQILLMIAVFIISFIIMIQRFYKSLLGEEGYLSFTLPVSATSHIVNKLIVSLIWSFATFLACALSIFLIIPDYNWIPDFMSIIRDFITKFEEISSISFGVLVAEGILMILVGSITSILMIYACLTLGHLAKSNRILVSFGAFFGLSTVAQAISSIVVSIFGYSNYEFDLASMGNAVSIILLIQLSIQLVLGIAYFIISNKILSKHLNLE